MTSEQQKPSIWQRIAAVLEAMDGAIDPSSHERARIALLEKRVEHLEASSLGRSVPE